MTGRHRRAWAPITLTVGLLLSVGASADAMRTAGAVTRGSSGLESALLQAVQGAGFDQVSDFGPVDACPGQAWCPATAPRIAYTPNVDAAVIELDEAGRPVAAADILLSRDYPQGVTVPIGPNLGTDAVRWRRWNQARWDGGTFSPLDGSQLTSVGWQDNPSLTAADDIVAGRENAPLDFMEPYPASVFKLLIAFHTLRLVDAGIIDLDQPQSRAVQAALRRSSLGDMTEDSPTAGGLSAAQTEQVTGTTRAWLDQMITASDNQAARALVKQLHDLHQIDALNASFRDLGLGTLQVNGTNPDTGGHWAVGQITMTSLDVARLLLIVNGSPGVLWRTDQGEPVTADVLSAASRDLLKGMLAEQGWNDILTTSNWCDRGYPAPGIPSLVADRWIDPVSGAVTVQGKNFGQDVRPCNDRAEVAFAHKTGFTQNFLADAGIVDSLPGGGDRHYIVVVLTNLGYRYADPQFASARTHPCVDPGVCYSERLAQFGKVIDEALKPQR